MSLATPAFDPNDASDLLDYEPAPIPDNWVAPQAVFGKPIIQDGMRADTILGEDDTDDE